MEEHAGDATRLGGYVLAGGRSSRMGRDKAQLVLGGAPLIAHALSKLRRVTGNANILAGPAPGDPWLHGFGPVVSDLHPGCGPLAGIEAALRHTPHAWNLILPVDVPFLPAAFLQVWVELVVDGGGVRSPVAMFRVDGRLQPTLLLIHRQVAPILSAALEAGEYKLLPVVDRAVAEAASPEAGEPRTDPVVFTIEQVVQAAAPFLTQAQRGAQSLWFANLNTPEDFAEAERHADVLGSLGESIAG